MSKRVDEYREISIDPGASALGARSDGETVRYPLGTAASADVTTSPTDATSGRVMRVDDYPSDSSWTSTSTLLNGWTGTVRYIKRAGMVTVSVDVDGGSKTGNVCLTLPANYQPAVDQKQLNGASTIFVDTSGEIESNASGTIAATFTYPVIT